MECCASSLLVFIVGSFILFKILSTIYRMQRFTNYDDYYIFVTGCDTGIGHDLVKRLDKYGCHVFAGCLTEKGETELTKACSNKLTTLSLDVTSHTSVIKALEIVKSKLPEGKGLQGVVNNAGIQGKIGPVEWLSKKDYEDVLAVNTLGLIDVTTVFLPLVKLTKGRIVNMSSMAGRLSGCYWAPYSFSKYGVEAFTDSLRRQLYIFGVTVCLIEPGAVATNFTSAENVQKSVMGSYNDAPEEAQEEYGSAFRQEISDSMIDTFTQYSTKTTKPFVNAYDHALLGKHPRVRYVVGFDANVVWRIIIMLPDWLADVVLRDAIKQVVPAAYRN